MDVDGTSRPAIAYPGLTGPVSAGDRVVVNTTARSLELGTGGYDFVVAVEGAADVDPDPAGHVMKLRYTPLQAKVMAVEEPDSPHRERFVATEQLDGLPVVWVPLHSMVGAAAAGAKAAGAERVTYVMTDGAALPAAFSRQIHELRTAGLLDGTITAGQAFGGDLEAVSVFSALLAGRGVAGADALVVSDGPGKVGTESRWGASDVAAGAALNAIAILGGRAIAALRLNFADPDYRHYGVSPHSLTVLRDVALAPVHVAIPTLEEEERGTVWEALKGAGLEERHQLVEVTGQPGIDLLRDRGVPAASMGWTLADEPALFLAAAAAGVLAGRMAAGSANWRRELET